MKKHFFISFFVQLVRTILSHAYQLLVPTHCFYCKQFCAVTSYALCNTCAMRIQPITTIDIYIKKEMVIKVFAAASYEYPVKMLILAKQYQQIYACKALAELIWEKTDIHFDEFDLIVPIPLHWKRYAKRGYNQAAEIADVLSKKMHIPVIHLLKKNKATAFQLTLSKEDRATNVANVFIVAKKEYINLYQNKRILLVDDLLTTGSTITSAGKVLLQLNPTSIKAVVGARVI